MAPGVISICAGGPMDDDTTVYVAEVSDFRVPHDPDADDDRSARSLEQAWADARLIAAAPDLLAALEQFTAGSWVEGMGCACCDPDCTDGECMYADARAAIAKARGEAPA